MKWFFWGWMTACAAVFLLGLLAGRADAQQLMKPDKLNAVRASLPILENEELNDLFHGDETIWYGTEEIPPAYQKQITGHIVGRQGYGHATFHNPYYNISADPSDSGRPFHGNGAFEFPWTVGKAGGTHNSPGVASVKGFHFPGPAVVFRRTVPGRVGSGNTTRIWDWVFADGTVFFEVLYQSLRKEHLVFEVRMVKKVGNTWEADVFRPFATASDLADTLEELGPGDWREPAITNLRSDEELPLDRLYDFKHHSKYAFDAKARIHEMPPLSGDDVQLLLDRPFVSCLGIPWKGDDCFAPSNASKYANIVPPNYQGAFVANSGTSQDCFNTCHASASRHVTEFQHPRGWYGRTPGGYTSRRNSWHPIEPSSIAWAGRILQVSLRQSFLDHGLVVFAADRLPEGYEYPEFD